MAFAETAELAVRLKLDAAAYEAGMKRANAATATFGKTAGAIGGHIKAGIGSAVTNLVKLGAVAGAGLATQVKFGIDSLEKLESVTAATDAALKSTKGVSGQTAQSIRDLANAFEDVNATIDDKVIQSAENLLLTFPKISKDAFKPTLQAALDLNTALGGGESGLQGVMIQVGKALQDPIRGLTALRRVGVSFSTDQEKQIKDLVKHNKLYEAQKIILGELTTEFGGRFAAAGKTSTAIFAALGDSVEELQMGLAEGLLPALVDVAKELTATFKDPAIKGAVKDLGKGLGDAFKTAVSWAKQIPWGTIGSALKTAAGAAGTLIKKFADAPDWLKTAVLTGWGLNKLTGGALTNIGGDIAKGIGGQLLMRGSSPGNPLYVMDAAGDLGKGGGLAAGGKGLLGTAVSIAQKVFIVGLAAEAADMLQHVLGGTLEDRTNAGTTVPGDQLSWPWGPKNTPKWDLGPFKNILGGDSSFTPAGDTSGTADTHSEALHTQMANIEAVRANTVALRQNAHDIEKAWLKTIDPKDIAGRSKAKTGRDATPAQIAAIRTRDELHQLKVITEKSQAKSDVKLERLRALAADAKAHGDTKTAAKVNKAISDMKAKVAAEQARTTSAVKTGTDVVAAAIAANGDRSDLNVYVTTNVTANGVVKSIVRSSTYGPSNNNKGTSGGKVI